MDGNGVAQIRGTCQIAGVFEPIDRQRQVPKVRSASLSIADRLRHRGRRCDEGLRSIQRRRRELPVLLTVKRLNVQRHQTENSSEHDWPH